jgi:hypothetical protein
LQDLLVKLLSVDSTNWSDEADAIIAVKLDCISALCEKLGPKASPLDGQAALAVLQELLFNENTICPDADAMLKHLLQTDRVKTLLEQMLSPNACKNISQLLSCFFKNGRIGALLQDEVAEGIKMSFLDQFREALPGIVELLGRSGEQINF